MEYRFYLHDHPHCGQNQNYTAACGAGLCPASTHLNEESTKAYHDFHSCIHSNVFVFDEKLYQFAEIHLLNVSEAKCSICNECFKILVFLFCVIHVINIFSCQPSSKTPPCTKEAKEPVGHTRLTLYLH